MATFTFEQMKTERQAEGVKMEPETGLASASVTSHSAWASFALVSITEVTLHSGSGD